jgi:hypothetical protein
LEIDMHRNRILMFFALALGMALALPSTASATVPLGYVQLSGSNLQDSTGTLLANATISFAPVNNAGQPISYQVNGHGQAMFIPVYALVTNGAFTVLIADSSLTNPVNVCYSVSVVNNVSGQSVLGGGYNCLQPSGSGLAVTGGNPWCTAAGSYGGTCNFDLYVPNEAGLVVEQPGTPGATGPPGPASTVPGPAGTTPTFTIGTVTNLSYGSNATATVSGGPAYTLSFGIPAGAQGATGSTGATGAAGTTPTFTIGTVNTLIYGSTATVTVSGGPAYTLSFGIPAGQNGAGAGTVTSVAITVPSWLTSTGCTITAAGTCAISGTSEPANYFLASPNGSAGAMTPRAIVAADIPTLNQSTSGTAAGLSATLTAASGGTGEAGTITGILYGNGTSAHTSATAAQIVAAISATAVANATNAAGLSATLAAASGGTGEAGTITGVAYHNGSGADTAATAAQIVAAISTTAVANATAAGTSTNTAGGAGGEILYQSAAGATGFSAAGTTGQSAVSGGTGAPTFSDLWLPEKIVPANCNNATAGNGMSLPTASAPTAVCRTGTYVQTGYLQFTATDSAQWQDEVPGDWDSANGPYVRVNYTQAAATASQSIIYTIAAVCSATVDDTVWPAVQTFATTTTGSTINTQYAQTLQLNSTTMANCAAGKMINFQINTASGSSATTNLQMVTVTWPHKTPGVAEAN